MRGDLRRDLSIGDSVLRIVGLDARLAATLEQRWGPFLVAASGRSPLATLQVHDHDGPGWLGPAAAGEGYRLEALGDATQRVVVSYNFALCAAADGRWRVAIRDGADEPVGRVLENAVRFLTARVAVELGGLPLHAAGVLRQGRAYLFAGPSRSGKTTAVSLSPETVSLGDDLGLVIPAADGWCAPALPFDNAERIEHEPPRGLLSLAGIWRLHRAREHRVERPPTGLAIGSLLACAAFPWAMPEQAEALLEAATRLVADGLFAHLHFAKDEGFWAHLVGNGAAGSG